SMGCRQDVFANIQNPNAVSKSVQDVSCLGASDGIANISVTGCVCQFTNCTFQWSNNVSTYNNPNVPAGTYYVTVTTTSGCIIEDSMTVNDGPPIIDSAYISPPVCRGDSNAYIILYPHYTFNVNYSWNNGETSHVIQWLSPDTFIVYLSYNTCFDTLKYVVPETDSFFINPYSEDVLCAGDSNGNIQLAMYWGLNYLNDIQYLCWDTNSNIDTSYNLLSPGGAATFLVDSFKSVGYYGVIVTNSNGCPSDTLWLDIKEPDSLTLMLSQLSATATGTFDGKAIAQVSGGIVPYTFQWNDPIQQSADTAFGLDSGIYHLIVTDSNNCTLIDSIYVGVLTGIEELEVQIGLFPNPSNGVLNIDFNGASRAQLRISIYNSIGQLLLAEDASDGIMNLQTLASARYIVVLENDQFKKVYHWIKQ
ncbi:MAG TPA: T9SS type A sorting domain-containing protein, partial [Bacteroidetes bacterium]|nr:T9SS type A sorting domain-containing protein [Bacteroidota bacterium]